MKILIATKNPGKIEGAKQAFSKFFKDYEIIGVACPSNVSEQPVNQDIYNGAKNRVENLISYANKNNIKADFYLSVESGITNVFGKWMITNIAIIKDLKNNESFGTSASFPVPNKYANEIISTDLGKVMDKIFAEHDLRSSIGGIGFLTDNVITRIDLTKEAFIMALTQFTNKFWNDFN